MNNIDIIIASILLNSFRKPVRALDEQSFYDRYANSSWTLTSLFADSVWYRLVARGIRLFV